MKKILLSLGSIATVVAPVAAVIACGKTEESSHTATVGYLIDKFEEGLVEILVDDITHQKTFNNDFITKVNASTKFNDAEKKELVGIIKNNYDTEEEAFHTMRLFVTSIQDSKMAFAVLGWGGEGKEGDDAKRGKPLADYEFTNSKLKPAGASLKEVKDSIISVANDDDAGLFGSMAFTPLDLSAATYEGFQKAKFADNKAVTKQEFIDVINAMTSANKDEIEKISNDLGMDTFKLSYKVSKDFYVGVIDSRKLAKAQMKDFILKGDASTKAVAQGIVDKFTQTPGADGVIGTGNDDELFDKHFNFGFIKAAAVADTANKKLNTLVGWVTAERAMGGNETIEKLLKKINWTLEVA